MATLHLGVVDIPYNEPPPAPKKVAHARRGKANRPRKAKGKGSTPQTTGSVAEILERKYHILEVFSEVHAQQMADDAAEAYSGAIEDIVAGAPIPRDPLAPMEAKTEERFRDFLSRGEIEGLGIPGVPTQAALEGVSHRFKAKKNKGGPRPSFIDTGQYESTMRVWSDAAGSEGTAESRPSGVSVG